MTPVVERQPRDILVSDVVYREDLYPRSLTNPERVQEYCENLDGLPPIEINQHHILIDGWHRWTAHRKADKQHIRACITETTSDAHLRALAVERNATHGMQLSSEDKERYAREVYHLTPERERRAKRAELRALLSVSEKTLHRWLDRIDKDTREANQKKAFTLWLAYHKLEAIAEAIDVPLTTVHDWSKEFSDFGQVSESGKAAASHATDFAPALYNVCKFQERTPGSRHYGNSEVTIVDELLYRYTHPFDVVVDPFAGGGSTIDICKKRLRRYWVSDRKPIVEREHEIRRWDITAGLPPLHRWQDVTLVYLDPPYWKQAEGKYSQDATDLANMDLETFHRTLADVITAFGKKLHRGAHIALLMQPTQWNAPDHEYTDHVAEMLRQVKLPLAMRVSCPYESQQYSAQCVEWAKAHKQFLVLTRELIIWKVA